NSQRVAVLSSEIEAAKRSLTWLIIATIGLALLAGAVALWTVLRGVTGPLSRLTVSVGAVAEGRTDAAVSDT
ncbi:hypothetical protein, partial [Proteus mirabilis]|uniref:hypothetical protein n=1 Tax=Proteus mirabilis TaxID=584 RepID=UPI001953DA2A